MNMHLLALKAQDKARMELSQDIVSGSTSICRTMCFPIGWNAIVGFGENVHEGLNGS